MTLANKSSKCTLIAAIGLHFSCQSDRELLRYTDSLNVPGCHQKLHSFAVLFQLQKYSFDRILVQANAMSNINHDPHSGVTKTSCATGRPVNWGYQSPDE
jgi:hypothetical protein